MEIHEPRLQLFLFVFVVCTKLVEYLETTAIAEFLWSLYTSISPSAEVRELRSLRAELVQIRSKRSNTSSKDEFAKWAHLDRQHTKLKAEIEKLQQKVGSSRVLAQRAVRALKWILTRGARTAVQLYYAKTPVMWLPRGFLPRPLLYVLALPRAPTGSLSAASWVAITVCMCELVASLVRK